MGSVAKGSRRLNSLELAEARGQGRLLELPKVAPTKKYLWQQQSIWTDNKALLIKRYLYYFVHVTRHGSYIDGFAGPQEAETNWAAKLVLESEPKWLRHFFLCELGPSPFAKLKRLRDMQAPVGRGKSARTIEVKRGDFNVLVHDVLMSPHLTEKEATFCLLDQRTFECHWATVEALARHKKSGAKIELFYFLACAWFDRAISRKEHSKLDQWWGNDGWKTLRALNSIERAQVLCERMKVGLGYKSATPFAIFKKGNTGRVMYYMIHATDHFLAPTLMVRAYNGAVSPIVLPEQLDLLIEQAKGEVVSRAV